MKVALALAAIVLLLVAGIFGVGSTLVTTVPYATDEQMALYEAVVQERGLQIAPAALIAVDAVRFHQDFGQVTPETIQQTADLFDMCAPFLPINWFVPFSPGLVIGQAFTVPRAGTLEFAVSEQTAPVKVRVVDEQLRTYPNGVILEPGHYEVISEVNTPETAFRLQLSVLLKPCGQAEVDHVMDSIGLQGDDRKMVLHIMAAHMPHDETFIRIRPGQYVWPVDDSWPLTDLFGPRLDPVLGGWGFHTGIDIAAPTGTSVHAATDSTVSFAGWDGNYGNVVRLNHGDGMTTVYAHLSMILVDEDQAVTKGQPVGLVGSTGKSTGPHLHFEWRYGGHPVDPLAGYH